MKIAFTLCSNNYWAHAKVLVTSLLEHNPDYKAVIGLVDIKSPLIDYHFHDKVEVLTVAELNIDKKYQIFDKYDIVELNTSVKATCIKRIKEKYPAASLVMYFDPDIAVFSKLTELENLSTAHSIVLTPHIYTPIPLDGFVPTENIFLNYGIYNLGFIAVSFHHKEVYSFLDWWEERTLQLGFNKPCQGIFVDQLWINLVPLYYKHVHILFHYGMNMAPWNLHERQLTTGKTQKNIVNEKDELVFYHFSSYNYNNPGNLSKHYDRYSFENRPDLKPLYNWYLEQLIKYEIAKVSGIPCHYVKTKGNRSGSNFFKRAAKKFTPPVMWDLGRSLLRSK